MYDLLETYTLLDTDFISKFYITQNESHEHLIDKVISLPYKFCCHYQIIDELKRHNGATSIWLESQISSTSIKKFNDFDILKLIENALGSKPFVFYLSFLKEICDDFNRDTYKNYYSHLEKDDILSLTTENFVDELVNADNSLGVGSNLGDFKNYVLARTISFVEGARLIIIMSDDKKCRNATNTLLNAINVNCLGISCLSFFCLIKEKNVLTKEQAKEFFDSWMAFHQKSNQTLFRVIDSLSSSPSGNFIKIEGFTLFNKIYDGETELLRNGLIKLKE